MAETQSPFRGRDEFFRGLLDEAPLMVGVMPFGLIFGALGTEAGLTPVQIMAMSIIIFGGASQVIFLQLYATGANPLLVSGTVSVINLRHTLYSASIAMYFRHLSLRWKVLLSYLLTDEAFAVTMRRYESQPPNPVMHYHLLGSGTLLWVSWQLATFIGLLLGAAIPPSLGLGFAIPLTFMAIIIPHIMQAPHFVAILTSGIVAILTSHLPWKLNLIIASMAGMLAGYLAEQVKAKAARS
jgi:predicted branched-subunit amino acid permease